MRILDRYIGITVFSHTMVVMSVFLSLFLFSFFINELDDVGKGSYSALDAFIYVILLLPRLAYQLFPPVALIGCILGLGVLASSSELMVIRAAGVSVNRIVLSVMKTGLLLMILAVILGEVIAPQSERYAQNMRSAALTNKITLKTNSGLWARDGDHFVHIQDLFADGSLGDISIYEMDKQHRLNLVTRAKRAYYQQDKWVLQEIARSHISKEKISKEILPNMNWESLLNPDLVGVVAINPDFLSAWGLYKYNNYLRDNGLRANRYQQAFWSKIVSPFTTGVMVFLAIPFIFGPLRSVSIGVRVVVGTLAGIGFHAVNQVTNYVGLLYEFNPAITVLGPPLLFLTFALYLARRSF